MTPEFFATTHSRKAVAIAIHGLNLKPSAMGSIITLLNQLGCDVYSVKLSGHEEGAKSSGHISRELWRSEMLLAYQTAKERATKENLPLFFLGYSLGALVGQEMIVALGKDVSIDRQILIAPAIAVRRRSRLIQLLFWLKNIYLPSFAPVKYRVNGWLSIRAYKAMFAMESDVRNSTIKIEIPTLVFIDPKDELISYKKLLQLSDRFTPGKYELVKFESTMRGRSEKYHHLVISEQTMGKKNWDDFVKRVRTFLFG